MNIGFYKKPKVSTLLTTTYFLGVLLSLSVMHSHQAFAVAGPMHRLAVVTFLTGIVAIYFTARQKRERIVYLNRKNEKESAQTIVAKAETQINPAVIRDIIRKGTNVQKNTIDELCRQLGAGQAALYVINNGTCELQCGYALPHQKDSVTKFGLGEGLVGRVALEGKSLYIDNLPEGYITIFSGLGSATASYLAIIPVISDDGIKGVIEIAAFAPITSTTISDLESIGRSLATTL
jgi:hypothetical protein